MNHVVLSALLPVMALILLGLGIGAPAGPVELVVRLPIGLLPAALEPEEP